MVDWKDELGLAHLVTELSGNDLLILAEARYRQKAKSAHPDQGGDPLKMIRLALYTKTFDESTSGLVLVVIATSNSPLSRKVMETSEELRISHPSRLNHAGRNVYVVFPISYGGCAASIQTYDISKSGDLSFNGGIMTGNNSGSGLLQAPAIIANDTFAYAASDFECCGGSPGWSGYNLGSSGEMENLTFNLSPYSPQLPAGYVPVYVTAGTGNYLAAIVSLNNGPETYAPPQLASYTVNDHGDLSTTSTATNMPYPSLGGVEFLGETLNMSPSGKLLAIAGSLGVQIFHFNGAAPITPYSAVLTTDEIDHIHWDNSNHLFALSDKTNKLYVFTVTPTTITPVAGSPFAIPATPNALVVVPK
jgi:hypothetical protein